MKSVVIALGMSMLIVAPLSNARAQAPDRGVTHNEHQVISTDAFLAAHPDLKFMLEGSRQLAEKDYKRAAWSFDRAGYYGDKMSQAALAELYWDGRGVPRDRPKAYAIADMAAQRLNNVYLLALRERYWEQLSESEQRTALEISGPIVERFSDEYTTPRLKRAMRSGQQTGRPKGSGSMLSSIIAYNIDGTSVEIRPDVFYAEKFWDVAQYNDFKDELVTKSLRNGKVTVKFGGKSESSDTQSDATDVQNERKDD